MASTLAAMSALGDAAGRAVEEVAALAPGAAVGSRAGGVVGGTGAERTTAGTEDGKRRRELHMAGFNAHGASLM